MAESLQEINKRIQSTKKTSHITKAMQMVSAAKLGKSEEASRSFQIYANKIREIVTHLAQTQLTMIEEGNMIGTNSPSMIDFHDMLVERPVNKTGYLIISSDTGLAGSYNSSVIKQTIDMISRDHQSPDEYVFMAIGSTAADFFKNRGMNVVYELEHLSDQPSFDEIRAIAKTLVEMFKNGVFDELYVCYNHHINTITFEYRADKMLPITDLDPSESIEYEQDYIYEPSKEEILDILLPQYAESLIYGAILDAKAAEHAARMTAMKGATDNAQNLVDDLSVAYNRARQAAITEEITEIIGGSQGLK
ncbi:F0F1 ATP synthase subunit gamma [Pisciglobus halotolerans]|uniref:ATP synthase gamma chain n=1 Tax=Pisciglobus halotolerans TaxID=745365 RepID=A0A1I3C4T1_9LACT|nr:F0F1 ATP synthase subunit gamma [Pisciglobus halotolerans]SFH69608.1 ATP synthase F1 subcomplex gamma subunit [Pisciglobus halotolerans]